MVPLRGGLVVYYFMNTGVNETTPTFPPGFRMISGDAERRNISVPIPDPPKSQWTNQDTTQHALRQKALGFNCLGSVPPEGSLQRHFLPSKTFIDQHCPAGLRLELMFPSCWDGVNLDSDDHRSHVAFPSMVQDGKCPDGFSTLLPTLFYEIAWETTTFKNLSGHFVLANNDPTGFGYHGDFISGWDPLLLRAAGERCTDESGQVEKCEVFSLRDEKCEFPIPLEVQNEDYYGPRSGLPGLA
ncbi:hypothetical protein H2198_007228 [Neophaeococcomyces mojaviensis]|uniref:Uncharacterized protein n=1 Tax=Neophaeococcomyces mojaviensis TaxID=3383035 RepID=A0ACC3A0K3_9EURO|nr:hypothetical protein H2198_007228 [Knufia sp. JES_112]